MRNMKIIITLAFVSFLCGCSTRYALTEVEADKVGNVFGSEIHEKTCYNYVTGQNLRVQQSCQGNNSNTLVTLSKKYARTDMSPGMLVLLGTVQAENYYFYKAEIFPKNKDELPYFVYFIITESWGSINTIKSVLSTSKSLSELEEELVNEITNRVETTHNKNIKERPSG